MVVDWKNKIIDIPITDLSWISGTFYEFNTEWFKDEIRFLESSIYGMPNLRIIDHNTSYTVAGDTYARKVEVVNGYKVRFEDGQYSVKLIGSNNNLFDVGGGVLFQNQVQVIPTNSAGLIVKTIVSGSGVTEQDKLDIADRVWDEMLSEHNATGSMGRAIYDVLSAGGSLTTEQANWLEKTYISTQTKLLTKSFWIAIK